MKALGWAGGCDGAQAAGDNTKAPRGITRMGRGATSRVRVEAGSAAASADGGGGGGSDGLELAGGVADPVAVGVPADWEEAGLWAPAGSMPRFKYGI